MPVRRESGGSVRKRARRGEITPTSQKNGDLGSQLRAGCVRAARPCRLLVVPAPVSERITSLMKPTRVDQQSFAGVVEPAASPGCAAVLAGTSALRPARVFPPCRTTGLGHAPLRPASPLRSVSRPSPPPAASRRQSPAVQVHRVLRRVGNVRASILHPRDLRRRPCGCCHSSFGCTNQFNGC